MASFDPKSFSRNEWGIIGGVLVAFIGLFLESFSVSVGPYSAGVSGWHWAGLWVPVIFLALPAAAIVAIKILRSDLVPANLPVTPRVATAALLIVAIVIEFIRALTYPGASGVSAGASYGTYIVTIATAVATAFAVLDFKESGEALPSLPAKSTTPTSSDD